METGSLNTGESAFVAGAEGATRPLIAPVCLSYHLPPLPPPDIYACLQEGCGYLLESVEGKSARYSVIGMNPHLIITLGSAVKVEGRDDFVSIAASPGGDNAFDRMRSITGRFQHLPAGLPGFVGGLVGYFAYDCAFSGAGIPKPRIRGGTEEPDAQFMLAGENIVFDHRAERLCICSTVLLTPDSDPASDYRAAVSRISGIASEIRGMEADGAAAFAGAAPLHPGARHRASLSKQEFEHAVRVAKEHIAAGDILQAVISRRLEVPVEGDPFPIYRSLRRINPGPYMYFIDFGDPVIAGSSPEMLVRVRGREVATVPIAGTRPRSDDPAEDRRLADEMLADGKERAEHIMLVDLARNDIGRVSKFGSVSVDEFMGVEKFSHVQHIVSRVSGELRDDQDCFDALVSCFPAGTLTGAPKIRAMEIIDDLEPCRRGIYGGAVGYMGPEGRMEFAIAIRTVIIRNGMASVQAGAGIVADSVPENEWQETADKAEAVLNAISMAAEADE